MSPQGERKESRRKLFCVCAPSLRHGNGKATGGSLSRSKKSPLADQRTTATAPIFLLLHPKLSTSVLLNSHSSQRNYASRMSFANWSRTVTACQCFSRVRGKSFNCRRSWAQGKQQLSSATPIQSNRTVAIDRRESKGPLFAFIGPRYIPHASRIPPHPHISPT